jgi:tRNA modification GTPase
MNAGSEDAFSTASLAGQAPALRAAVLTPAGRGAVAVVRVTGPGAAAVVARHFATATGKPWTAPPGRISFGRFRPATLAEAPSELGEELVVTARSAGDVEIHGHGGKAAVDVILQTLAADGCRIVDWRELLISETADRILAEATIALAEARTARTAAVLLDQQAGALRRAIDAIGVDLRAGEVNGAAANLDALLRFAPLGRCLTEPFRVTLAGRPNVGKSSLLNALVGYDRAIVFDLPGTTRDVVTAVTALDGWPVELADTAGRRESADPLEVAGIDRAVRRAEADDLTVLVCDASTAWTGDDEALAATLPDALVVHNKCDLEMVDAGRRPTGSAVSAATGAGLAELQSAIVGRLVANPPRPGEAVPFSERQIEALIWAREAVIRGDRLAALEAITGL